MNTPNCGTIGGEVPFFRGGAGGLSYFSSGSFRGALYVGASWPEAPARQASELRQINTCSRLAVSRRLCCVATRLATGRVRPAGRPRRPPPPPHTPLPCLTLQNLLTDLLC